MTAPLLHSLTIQESSIDNRFHLGEEQVTVQRASWRHRHRLIAAVFLCVLASAGVLAAQAPPQKATTPAPGITLRQTVRRVRVDVVVTDVQGRPVAGLLAADFHVVEDRKRSRSVSSNGTAKTTRSPRFPSVRNCLRTRS